MAVRHEGIRAYLFALRRWRGALPFVFLTMTLVIAAVLAYQANDAARSHRNTVENTLRDYAGIAVAEYTRRSRTLLKNSMDLVWRDVERYAASNPTTPPSTVFLARVAQRRSLSAHTFFRIDFPSRVMNVTLGESSRAAQDWLRDTVLAHYDPGPDTQWHLLTVGKDVEHLNGDFVFYWLLQDRRDSPRAVYGFVTNARAVGQLFTSCSREELLPPTLADGKPTDSLLFLVVSAKNDVPVFKSPVEYDLSFAAADTLGEALGGFIVQGAVRPDAAANLIIGGLPHSKLPLLLGLFVLSLGTGTAALNQLRRERQLARLRDDFVSGVSHELRTPLAQIRMFGELLDGGHLRTAEERERSANVINREARRLTHLVENILHFSRLRRRPSPVRVEDTALNVVVDETLESFGPLFRARGVTVERHLHPSIVVPADPNALSQILVNLLDNALKYGPEGQTIRIFTELDRGDIAISVEDEGPGVPDDAKARIWEAYRRLDRDANTTVAGCGIGLAVVSQLTALHGGWVSVEDGQIGARFVVRLPGGSPSKSDRGSAVSAVTS